MHIFVYGTLRKSASHPMHALLEPARFVGDGRFQGKIYDLGSYPGVVASDDPVDCVRGEIHLLLDPVPTLAALDRYEACTSDDPVPHEYVRVTAQVRLETSGEAISAQIYLYNQPVSGFTRIESGDYLEWLAQRSSAPADG